MLAYFRGASIILFGSVYYRQLPYDLFGLFASRIFPLILLVALIGGGLGIAFSQYNVMNGVHKGSASGTTFAGQGKAGISYELSKDTSFYLGYRIVWINGGNTIDVWSDNPKTQDHLQQSVDAGIRIRL